MVALHVTLLDGLLRDPYCIKVSVGLWTFKFEGQQCPCLLRSLKLYLPLFWPVQQSRAAVEYNLTLSQNTPISWLTYCYTGSSRLMRIPLLRISLQRFFKTITKIWLMRFYGLFILLMRT